jgi:hypothetical protein
MFALEFDRKVIGTNSTTFYQYLREPRPRGGRALRAARDDAKVEAGRSFMAFAHRHVDRVSSNPAERGFYHLAVAYFGHKRACSWSKILRRRLAGTFGSLQEASCSSRSTWRS